MASFDYLESFPLRKTAQSLAFKNQSYGLIIFSRDTKRCAVVKRKYSFAYYDLLRGFYRRTYFDDLIKCLTLSELKKVFNFVPNKGPLFDNGQIDEKNLKLEGSTLIYDFNEYDFERASIMLKSSRNRILEYENELLGDTNNILGNLEEEWVFPKGHSKENETIIETAIRECEEELGVKIHQSTISDSNIIDIHDSLTNGLQYKTTYWPILVEKELDLPEVDKNEEISGRSWMTLEDLKTKTRSYNYKIAVDSFKILNL